MIRLPRMRGDRPSKELGFIGWHTFTPHARGSTSSHGERPGSYLVYPACAGIDRKDIPSFLEKKSLPRMRGDRPTMRPAAPIRSGFTPHARGSTEEKQGKILSTKFTPHARGSTYPTNHNRIIFSVYPACAGIDPQTGFRNLPPVGLPRMRGDRPRHGQHS